MEPSYRYRAVLRSVYDADTVRADLDLGCGVWLKNEQLRLYGIDAPEVRGAQREAGLKARDYLRERLEGAELIVETLKDKKGKYGRYVATIWASWGGDVWVNMNLELVQAGHAIEKHY